MVLTALRGMSGRARQGTVPEGYPRAQSGIEGRRARVIQPEGYPRTPCGMSEHNAMRYSG